MTTTVKKGRKHIHGWHPSLPDHRDHLYSIPVHVNVAKLPKSVDLRKSGFMPPVYDQGQLGSCHDANTEVLTENGWRLFSDLTGEERLATVDPATSRLIYEKPTRIVRLPFKGELVIGRNDRSLDFAVTPDHKMLVRKWDESKRKLSDDYSLVDAKDIGWYSGLMNNVSWGGEVDVSQKPFARADAYVLAAVSDHKHKPQREPKCLSLDTWLQFLGIYLAEGTLLRVETSGYKIQLAATKEREKAFIRSLMSEMGLRALELPDRFTFENRQVYEEMTRLGLKGVHAPEKFVPPFVFKQNANSIAAFLTGHFMGDGHEQNGTRSHYTSSPQLADDLQLLAFLSGAESHVSVREPRTATMTDGREVVGRHPEYRVSVCARKNLSIERSESITREHYEGEVFCAEVPTYHTLVTRRNYRILISGNCTGNAIAGAIEFDRKKQKLQDWAPSRLFIYYNERVMENSVASDSGAQIRDGIKSVNKQGACKETTWPYNTSHFATKPPAAAYTEGKQHEAVSYKSISQDITQIKACLAEGYPIVFGFTCYSAFEQDEVAQTGILNLPQPNESCVGGHAVLMVGYDDDKQMVLVRNSWGHDWGQDGYFWMDYAYISNPDLADDFWSIRTVK